MRQVPCEQKTEESNNKKKNKSPHSKETNSNEKSVQFFLTKVRNDF